MVSEEAEQTIGFRELISDVFPDNKATISVNISVGEVI